MLCLRIGAGPRFYGAGLPYGWGKIYKHARQWTGLRKGKMPDVSHVWEDWSFRACGDRLQWVVNGDMVADARDADIARGSVGARVLNASLYLDDIRVRKFSLPEPSATLPVRNG